MRTATLDVPPAEILVMPGRIKPFAMRIGLACLLTCCLTEFTRAQSPSEPSSQLPSTSARESEHAPIRRSGTSSDKADHGRAGRKAGPKFDKAETLSPSGLPDPLAPLPGDPAVPGGRNITATGRTMPPTTGRSPSPLLKASTQSDMLKAQKQAEERNKAWDSKMKKTMGSICSGC